MAFPYKPEEVYEMDYHTLMMRAAQAERKLSFAGLMETPLHFETIGSSAEQQQTEQEKKRKHLEDSQDMINKYYEQQGIKVSDSVREARKAARKELLDTSTLPPIPESTGEQTIITKSDMMEHEAVLTGHDQDIVHKMKATDETAQIYTDYLDQLKKGDSLKIMTPEERKAAAEERMEANKQKLINRRKQAIKDAKAELPELLRVREEARKRKEKKAARRKH